MNDQQKNLFRRDFLKGLLTLPFLGYFAFGFRKNITKEMRYKSKDYRENLGIEGFESTREKLLPSTGNNSNRIRFGMVGHGWRSVSLMSRLGYTNGSTEKDILNGRITKKIRDLIDNEDLNLEYAGVCDTFKIHAERGAEYNIPFNNLRPGSVKRKSRPVKIYPTYREMIASDEIDAIVIATPDHTHAQIAIDAAKAGKHVYLEKPMTHSIEEAIELRDTIKSTGVVFQLGHINRQQMSFKIAREMYQKGVLGIVTMIETFTNKNTLDGAWIREREFDHLGNPDNINWKEFLGKAPWCEFDPKRYFNWQRYSDYGTSVTGNNFTHRYDCLNQILDLGIPENVVATGGQYYYKDHGDMPDVMNAIFNYPERGLTMTYNCSLKNGIYRQARIWGSEATMDVDREIKLYRDKYSNKYKSFETDRSEPMYHYAANTDVDAVTAATAQEYISGGSGPTFIDGQVKDVTFLHIKEWIDAIRGQGKTSCDIDAGFEETVTFNMANLAYEHKKPVRWDKEKEKAIIG